MPITQTNREVEITTPLGADELMLRDMTCTEELGRLFSIDLELVSLKESIKFEDLLGEKVSIRLDLPNDEKRYFHGHITHFSQSSNQGSFAVYQATVRPWLWFLTRTSDCRIFQQKTVPDIVKEVFRNHGYTDFEEKLSNSYRTWEYCVQYRETDFNFVSRLLEQEGIYYYFKHEESKHTLILCDGYGSHEKVTDYETIPYYPPDDTTVRDEESISNWLISKQIQPGTYALNEYDFTRPKADLKVNSTVTRDHSAANFEVYDYPGEYVEAGDGDVYVRTRIEELHAQYEEAQGQSDARGIMSGGLFELSEYPREDQNREYLVVSATHDIHSDDFDSGGSDSGPVYSNSFSAIESQIAFRSVRTTPKPIVQGPQTAVVVGPSSEEIYTDKHGRVKLQFHWDRYGQSDENSSCWVRVSQVHAGKGFGGIDTPRIGEEVIVEFLEGDADRPIITGRVYNGDNKPPNGLPSAKMVSGLKSNSTPGGGGDNAIMLDDMKGNEKISIHAQYDMGTTVDHDQTNTVKNNFTETITNNSSVTVSKGTYTHDVKANTAAYHVNGALTEKYDDVQSTTVKKDITIKSTTGAISVKSVTAHVHIDASTNIKLHVGASTIKMDKAGNITIDGVNITINGKSSVIIKGGIVHSEAKAQHQIKGAVVESSGSATNTVKGGTVLLNP